MMTRLPYLFTGLTLLAAPPARATEPKPPVRWLNASEAPLPVAVKDPPDQPIVLQVAPNGRPFRILPAGASGGALRIALPPRSSAEVWDRRDLAAEPTPFGNAARWGALPRIVLGPASAGPGEPMQTTPPWSDAAGLFRAYPNGEITVTVTVRNDDLGVWTHPRVELFAPDDWQVTPKVAEVLSPQKKAASPDAPSISAGQSGVLPPTVTGTATFSVRIPDSAQTNFNWPLIAFLRFNTIGETLTVQNSVEVRVEAPVAPRYGMNEVGTKFVTHLENRFRPAALGEAEVRVTAPAGSGWKMAPSAPVDLSISASAVSETVPAPPGDAGIRVPVTVSVSGSVLHGFPLIHAAARYDGDGAHENGLHVTAKGSPADGLAFAGTGPERALAFIVDADFAVSDPAVFVSPTWVTTTLNNRGAGRARLEYDAFGSGGPSVAADVPLPVTNGPTTLSFLLPDARFAGGLPGGADLRLVLNGDAVLHRITASKWNPAKG